MNDKVKDWCTALGLSIPITVYAVIMNSYVFMCIWEWFISIPFGLSLITYKTALCICTVVSFLTSGWTHIPSEAVFGYLRHIVVSPIVTLVMCYLVQALYVNG